MLRNFIALSIIVLFFCNCSKDALNQVQVDSKLETDEKSPFVVEDQSAEIASYIKSLKLSASDGLDNLVKLLSPIEPGQYILRNLEFKNILAHNLDESKIAKKKALDDFYNIKYTLLFDYRKELSKGLNKKEAIEAVRLRSLPLVDKNLKVIIDDFLIQIKDDQIELSAEQEHYISLLQESFLLKQKIEFDNFEQLRDSNQESLKQYIVVDKPHVTHHEMDLNDLKSFKKLIKLSIYGGEISSGPTINFMKKGQVTIHKIWDGEINSFFACSLTMSAVATELSEGTLVTAPYFKDSRKIEVSSTSKFFESKENIATRLILEKCEKNHFSKVRESLSLALEVKAGEMVYQGKGDQCEVNEDCKRWFQLNSTNYQRKNFDYTCDRSKANSSFNSCVVTGKKGASCRVVKDELLRSSGLNEASCKPGLSCKTIHSFGWFKNGKVFEQAKGECL